MDREEFHEAIAVLGGEHTFPILEMLYKKGWSIASDVSIELGIHTTTATKYLSGMHGLGWLEKRVRKCKTRKAFEYRLKSPRLEIKLDIGKVAQRQVAIIDVYRFYLSLFFTILDKSKRIGGSQLETVIRDNITDLKKERKEATWLLQYMDTQGNVEVAIEKLKREMDRKKIVEDVPVVRDIFIELITRIIDSYEDRIGKIATKRIVDTAINKVLGKEELIQKYRLLDGLPREYFEKGGMR